MDRKNIIGSIGRENFGEIKDGRWVKANSEDLTKLEERLAEVTLQMS